MQFYRLVKPIWAQPLNQNKLPNPKFIKAIDGPNIIEGVDFSEEYLRGKNKAGYNIYFFPNHPTENVYEKGITYLSGKDINKFSYLFVDMDLKDGIYATKEDFLQKLKEFELEPTMVVDSGNGIHAYWRVEDLTREYYVLAQMALLTHFKTDPSIWTVLQLMRLPGFDNTKDPANPKESKILEDKSSGKNYKKSDFPKSIFNLKPELITKVQNHINRLEGKLEIELDSDINVDEIPDEFFSLMLENPEIARLFREPNSYGDRSSADMKLTNFLFNKKFNIQQALAVISNTQKALEKPNHRMDYAQLTVSKVYSDRPKNKFQPVSAYLLADRSKIIEPQIYGPHYMDYEVLGEPWRAKELLGIIAGAGVGKTAVALNIVKEIIENNPHNEDIYVFFSLEMSKGQIIKRWVKLVGENSKLADRLYVVDSQDENGMPLNIGLQEIYEYCSEIKQVTGKNLGAYIIDHFHIISTHIDINKKPNFGIGNEQGTGWGSIQNLSLNGLATQLKSLTKTLNTFGIILSQTTKEKGVGDLPIGKDGAYGASQYEWIMDRILTIWQPLMRVQSLTPYRFLAFQYAKIREKHKNDLIQEYDPKLLTYNMETGTLEVTTPDEYETFRELLPKANEAREATQKKKSDAYSIQFDLEGIKDLVKNIRVTQ